MKKHLSPHITQTIAILRTILCIQIVFLHMVLTAPVQQDFDKQYTLYHNIISFLTIFNNIAVPLFAIISGYLFFYNYTNTIFCYKNKIIKRIKRLLQPVFIWTSTYLLLYYMAQQFPYTAGLFSGQNKLIADFGWKDFINAYTGIFSGFPFAGQYWFLIDLFLVSLFSPVILFLFKKNKFNLIIITIIWYILSSNNFYYSFILKILYFFILGAYMSINNIDIVNFIKRTKVGSFILAILLWILTYIFQHSFIYNYIFHLFLIIGTIAITNLGYILTQNRYGQKLIYLSTGSYFCFLLHQQLLMFIKRAVYRILSPHSNIMLLLLYIIIPSLIILICYILFHFLQKRYPKILNLLLGNN